MPIARVIVGLVTLLAVAAPSASAEGLNAFRVKATAENLRALALAGFDVTEGRDLEARHDRRGRLRRRLAKLEVPSSSSTSGRPPARPAAAAPDRRRQRRRLDRLDEVRRRARRRQGAVHRDVRATWPRITRESSPSASTGHDLRRARHRRPPGDEGRHRLGHPGAAPRSSTTRMQHAREWLAGRDLPAHPRLLRRQLRQGHAAPGIEVTQLVNTTELWFVCVNNPDGYEFTFTPGNRLWRKNLPTTTATAGSRPATASTRTATSPPTGARDNEGSSPRPVPPRPTAGRRPRPSRRRRRWRRSSRRSTRSSRRTTTRRRSCCSTRRGSSRTRRAPTTRSSRRSRATRSSPRSRASCPSCRPASTSPTATSPTGPTTRRSTLSFTPEGTSRRGPERRPASSTPTRRFRSQQEFQRHLPFVLDLAQSADDPAEPDSHLGNKAATSSSTRSQESYGDPQPVGAVVKRKLGKVRCTPDQRRQAEGRADRRRRTTAASATTRTPGVFYHRVRGVVEGHQARRRGQGLVLGRRPGVGAPSPTRAGRRATTRC